MQANLKKALVLFFIAVISGLSIWLVNQETEEQIAMKKCLETAVDKNNCSKN